MNHDQQRLIDDYVEVMTTDAGRRVLADMIAKFSVTVPVYALGDTNLSDISYRDGQRNAGIYIYNLMALASPADTALIHQGILEEENARIMAKLNEDHTGEES